MAGIVYLVGAGPGDPGLLTVRGRECLVAADVVVADHLAPESLLGLAPDGAERIVRGPRRSGLSQQAINALLVDRARAGRRVVRLKGGDPFVFGRGGEEAEALVRAGVPFEVVPGVTSGVAVPAYAGIPVTHRDATGAVAFATGHAAAPDDAAGHVAWEALARGATTLVLYMSLERLDAVMERLVAAGRAPSTPAAVISHGTRPTQRTVVGTVGDIAARARAASLPAPALTVVGDVVRLRDELGWFEGRPLLGARVLVTRAAGQAEPVVERLARLGADVLAVPAIEILPPTSWAPLDEAIAGIARYRLVAVASANAVEALFDRLAAAGRDARALAGAVVAAVGPRTAAALAAHGIRADVVASESTAEGLVAALATVELGACPALLPRAADGREALAEALAARGISVDAPAAYRSAPVARERLAHAVALLRDGAVDAVTFGSPRTAHALLDALGDPAPLASALIATVGPTTARALAERGVRVDLVAAPHTFDALVDALAAALPARVVGRRAGT